MSHRSWPGLTPARSTQMRMSSITDVSRAWRRSAERVSSTSLAVGAQVQALELGVAGRVVAGQVVHALLPEDQQGGEAIGLQFGDHPVAAGLQFFFGEMQRHIAPPFPLGYRFSGDASIIGKNSCAT